MVLTVQLKGLTDHLNRSSQILPWTIVIISNIKLNTEA